MIDYDLKKIKMVIFDVDGVLSRQTILLASSGEPLRTVNIKDGYAIQLGVKMGLQEAILTGGNTKAVQIRYERLGVQDVIMNASVKIRNYEALLKKYHLQDEEVLYMGDDIPDYEVMRRCGCACCPHDAALEMKEISCYICSCNGGDGCAREVLEQVLRAQNKWLSDERAFGW